MDPKPINVGFGNIVFINRAVSIVFPESAPIRRIVSEGKDKGLVVDATYGRKTRAVIIMDDGHIVLSPIMPETIARRIVGDLYTRNGEEEEEMEEEEMEEEE